jgi:hypothetical protein
MKHQQSHQPALTNKWPFFLPLNVCTLHTQFEAVNFVYF